MVATLGGMGADSRDICHLSTVILIFGGYRALIHWIKVQTLFTTQPIVVYQSALGSSGSLNLLWAQKNGAQAGHLVCR